MHQRLNDHFQVGWPITFEFGEDVFFSADMDEDDGLGLVWKSSEY
jgi:hypothetical protein